MSEGDGCDRGDALTVRAGNAVSLVVIGRTAVRIRIIMQRLAVLPDGDGGGFDLPGL